MATREAAKAKRKAQILLAARQLMREPGRQGFSMRALAETAGVSSATPYNLFGSKQAILIALLDADFQDYRSELQSADLTGIERIFEAIEVMHRFLHQEPEFYRALMCEVGRDEDRQMRQTVGGSRYILWKDMLSQAVDLGLLYNDVNLDALAITLGQMFVSNLHAWGTGEVSLNEMSARIRYGLGLYLLGVATAEGRPVISQRWRSAEQDLQTYWRRALQARLNNGTLDADTKQFISEQLNQVELAN